MSSLRDIEKFVRQDEQQNWMQIPFQSVQLHKDNTYGFRLMSPDTLVAIGEAAWSSKNPFVYGEEWKRRERQT